MSGYRACSQCQGLMVLEDQGELLEALDVMSLFEYRCRACGHLERSEKVLFKWRRRIPTLRVDLSKAVRENR